MSSKNSLEVNNNRLACTNLAILVKIKNRTTTSSLLQAVRGGISHVLAGVSLTAGNTAGSRHWELTRLTGNCLGLLLMLGLLYVLSQSLELKYGFQLSIDK